MRYRPLMSTLGRYPHIPDHSVLKVQPSGLMICFPDGRPGPTTEELAEFYRQLDEALDRVAAEFYQTIKRKGDVLYAQ